MMTLNDDTQPIIPNNGTVNYQLASWKDRIFALLIDGLIFGILSQIHAIAAVVSIVSMAYHLTKDALPFLNGQSIGKKIMKIRVLDAETGQPITNKYDKTIIRAIPLMLIFDCFMVFSSDKRRFGDKWAKTIVVKEQ